ncbi:MAG: hypothetical protein AB7F64_08640, partial [Gammaproteobacteria bacterium]
MRAGATKPKAYFSFIYLHNLTLLWDEHWSKNKNEILSSIEWKDIVILATRKKDTDVLNAFIESNKILDENCLIEMVSNDLTTQFNNYCIKHKPLLTQACLQKLVLASIKNNNQNLLSKLMRMPILKNDSAFINQALIESITANNQTTTDIILRSLPSLSLIKWHEFIPHTPSVNMLHYLARFGDCKQALINHIDKIYDLFTHEQTPSDAVKTFIKSLATQNLFKLTPLFIESLLRIIAKNNYELLEFTLSSCNLIDKYTASLLFTAVLDDQTKYHLL